MPRLPVALGLATCALAGLQLTPASRALPDARGSRAFSIGATVLLAPRTRATRCTRGANPDRRCSPGAYATGLTRKVLCSSTFRTGTIRSVTQADRHAVEREYGLAEIPYGRRLEIDHIVALELGGSNDIANLFPQRASPSPGYRAKDKLENRLHAMVCDGQLGLAAAQRRIASNWQALYTSVFGVAPLR
jgi:hypothetical protein